MSEHRSEGMGEADVRRLSRDETREREVAHLRAIPIADPTPVGLAAFALTAFLFSIINAGWLEQIGTFIPLAFFYGGLVQLLAGTWEFRNNNTFGALVFTSYGAFWGSLGFFFFYGESLGVLTGVGPSVGFTLLGWSVFTLYVWIASIKVNRAVFITFTVFLLTLTLLALGFLLAIPGLVVVGGYTGIILALCAWYSSAAGVINYTFGRIVLPIGSPFGELQPEPAPTPSPERIAEHTEQLLPQELRDPLAHTPPLAPDSKPEPTAQTPHERIREQPLPQEPGQQPTPSPAIAVGPATEPPEQTLPERTTKQPTPDATGKESTTQESPEESQQQPPELLPAAESQSAEESQPYTTEQASTSEQPPGEAASAQPFSERAASQEITQRTPERGREEAAEAVSFQDTKEIERSTTREDIQEPVGKSEVSDQEAAAHAGTTAAPESQPGATELPIKDYDSFTVVQITKRLSGLSIEQLEQLRDYEAENKNRKLLIERLEKRIRIIR